MILLYLLFALTISMVFTALISAHIPQNKEGMTFIGFFVALVVLALGVDEWLIPVLAAGQKSSFLPILLLIIFGGIFTASTILTVRSSAPLRQAVVSQNNRLDSEAMIFDFILWLALLTAGIAVLKSNGI